METGRVVAPAWAAGLLAALTLAASGAARVAVPSGEYELTTETVLPHLEEALRYATTQGRRCFAEPDADSIFPLLRHQAFTGCHLAAPADGTAALRFQLQCANPQAATGSALVELEAGRLAAVLEIKMGGKNMTLSQRVHGRRIGPCAQAPGENGSR